MDAQLIVDKFYQGYSLEDLYHLCLAILKEERKEAMKNIKRGGQKSSKAPSRITMHDARAIVDTVIYNDHMKNLKGSREFTNITASSKIVPS